MTIQILCLIAGNLALVKVLSKVAKGSEILFAE